MSTMKVNVQEAKTHFSRLLQRVQAGEEITIPKAGVPVARLVPVGPRNQKRELGFYGDSIRIAEDFDAPLSDAVVAAFLGAEPSQKNRRKK
jgi:prevent-host-death family protein